MTVASPASEEPPNARSTLQLLGSRPLGPYFAAKLLASVGGWAHSMMAAIVVFDVTRSAFMVGLVSIVQFGPQILLTPFFGLLADRGNRRVQVVVARLISATGGFGLGLWLLAVGDLGALDSAWPVIASSALVGLGQSLGQPAMHALLPALVRPTELATAVAIDTVPLTVARATGPAIGAVLLTAGGPAFAFLLAGAGHFVLALTVAMMHLRPLDEKSHSDSALLAGLRYVTADRPLALLLLAVLGIGIGVDPIMTLSPAIADAFGDARWAAYLMSGFGIGAMIGPGIAAILRRSIALARLGAVGTWLMVGGLTGLAVSPSPTFAIASVLVQGLGLLFAISSYTALTHQRSPEALRGRVMALWVMCFVGSRPIAAGVNGAIADLSSPNVAILIVAATLALIALVARPSRVDPEEPLARARQRR